MNRRTLIYILFLIITVTVVAAFVPMRSFTGEKPPLNITVLFFNDSHGHLRSFKVKTDTGKVEVGGIARLAELVENIRVENNHKGVRTFLLLAGDILQGTPMSTVFQGRPDVECFNAMGVDAMTVGNHEFDFGFQNFLDLKKIAAFPFLSSNIIRKDSGKLICEPWISFPLTQNISLSVIGATTRDLLVTTRPDNVNQVTVLDSVQTVKDAVGRLHKKGPVILLSHSKHKTDRAIARAVPELSAIIGGHDQILLSPYRKVGNVPIFQAFEKCRYLGRIDLAVDPVSGRPRLVAHSYIPVAADINPNPEIDRIVKRYHSRMDKKFKEVIGESRVFLDGEREKIRYEETTLGNFVSDIMREYTGADVALLNSGSLRASIDTGPVTREEVFKAMPYANEIILLDLTGTELIQALTRSVRATREEEDGGFLQVSGIRFNVREHAVERVRLISNHMPVEPEKIYRVAVTDFLASGGDGYKLFVGKPIEHTRSPLRELIMDTINIRRIVKAEVQGRIVRIEE
ncbi:MAG: 5'-nucleotidase C-terminal domain-containing protein [Desulfobacterales bacterium]|jgi:5'-nucleotidase